MLLTKATNLSVSITIESKIHFRFHAPMWRGPVPEIDSATHVLIMSRMSALYIPQWLFVVQ